jgi:hypothetical protein
VGAESIIGPAFPELAHSRPLHVKDLIELDVDLIELDV